MEDYETTYEEFWKEIVENPDGSLNLDQVKRELHDYERLLSEVPQVFCHVTGGLISKPNTKAECVIEEFENYMDKEIKESILDYVGDAFYWLEGKLGQFPIGGNGESFDLRKARKEYLEMLKKS